MQYDLEKRTGDFGIKIISFLKKLPVDHISKPLVSQLARSPTSIGANYMEANGASSKKDFTNKIFICKKEAQETKHWLRMLSSCNVEHKDELRKLWQECQELTLIFQKIGSSSRKPSDIEN